MQLAANQLSAHLSKGLRSLYTVHGDEPLLVQEAADAIRTTARAQGYTERTVHTVAGAHFDWSEVLASGGSLSLFADKQLIEVRVPSGKPGKDGSQVLQQIAASAEGNDSTLTLVVLPLRIGVVWLQRRVMFGESFRSSLRVSLALAPTLIFTLVLAAIMRERFQIPAVLFGALLLYAALTTLLPSLVFRTPFDVDPVEQEPAATTA